MNWEYFLGLLGKEKTLFTKFSTSSWKKELSKKAGLYGLTRGFKMRKKIMRQGARSIEKNLGYLGSAARPRKPHFFSKESGMGEKKKKIFLIYYYILNFVFYLYFFLGISGASL